MKVRVVGGRQGDAGSLGVPSGCAGQYRPVPSGLGHQHEVAGRGGDQVSPASRPPELVVVEFDERVRVTKV